MQQEGKKMPKFTMRADCHDFFFLLLFFLTETMELRLIHIFSVPIPLCLFHSLMTTWWAVPTRVGLAVVCIIKKCNKCFQWITGFNSGPQYRLIFIYLLTFLWSDQLLKKHLVHLLKSKYQYDIIEILHCKFCVQNPHLNRSIRINTQFAS